MSVETLKKKQYVLSFQLFYFVKILPCTHREECVSVRGVCAGRGWGWGRDPGVGGAALVNHSNSKPVTFYCHLVAP